MKQELSLQMQEWIEKDASASEAMLSSARKRNMKTAPLWLVGSTVVMVAIGLICGYDIVTVLKRHFLIGFVFGALIALYVIWQQSSLVNKKTIIKAYTKGAQKHFKNYPQDEQTVFLRQMQENRFDTVEYQESQVPFLSKVMIGDAYWVYRNATHAEFVRVADIASVQRATSHARVSYEKSSSTVKKNVAIGIELVISLSDAKSTSRFFFEDNQQLSQVTALIQKHCPQITIEN